MSKAVDDNAKRCEQLYRSHADAVHAYARRRSDAHMADEVVAEVFLVAWRRLDVVPAEALPWLLGVARRTLANHRRTRDRALALSQRLEATAVTRSLDPNVDHDVLEALARLHPRDQEILLLVAWEGLDHAEIAQMLDITRATVATRLLRARRRLTHALENHAEPALGRGEVTR